MTSHLLGPKPNQLLAFKRPQLAVKLESLMQAATSAAAKHMNILVIIVTDDGHALSSRLVQLGDASFLVGHLLLACFTLLGMALGFS